MVHFHVLQMLYQLTDKTRDDFDKIGFTFLLQAVFNETEEFVLSIDELSNEVPFLWLCELCC